MVGVLCVTPRLHSARAVVGGRCKKERKEDNRKWRRMKPNTTLFQATFCCMIFLREDKNGRHYDKDRESLDYISVKDQKHMMCIPVCFCSLLESHKVIFFSLTFSVLYLFCCLYCPSPTSPFIMCSLGINNKNHDQHKSRCLSWQLSALTGLAISIPV